MPIVESVPEVTRIYYEIRTRHQGKAAPFFEEAETLNQAREIAANRARRGNTEIVELDWRQTFDDQRDDGIFICAIRRLVSAPLCPRVMT